MTLEELLNDNDVTAHDLASYIQDNLPELNEFSGSIHESLTALLVPVIEHFDTEILSLTNEVNDAYERC